MKYSRSYRKPVTKHNVQADKMKMIINKKNSMIRNIIMALTTLAVACSCGASESSCQDKDWDVNSLYRKYPHLKGVFPYFAYCEFNSTTIEGKMMIEKLRKLRINSIISYNFHHLIAELAWNKERGWYEEKNLKITPTGEAYFKLLRENKIRVFGHIQAWTGKVSNMTPMKQVYNGPEREPSAEEIRETESLLKGSMEWFAKLENGPLKDVLWFWATDDEPENIGPTKAMEKILRRQGVKLPIFNVSPWMGSATKLVKGVEVLGCDFYVHRDCFRHSWDMQDKFEKLYTLNPNAILFYVGDPKAWEVHQHVKDFQRDGRPKANELRSVMWQAIAGGAKGIGFWNIQKTRKPWWYSNEYWDYFLNPSDPEMNNMIEDFGGRIGELGSLIADTKPVLDTRPEIEAGTINEAVYTGPRVRCGTLKFNGSDEHILVIYNLEFMKSSAGTMRLPVTWNGRSVFSMDTMQELRPGHDGRYTFDIVRGGDAVVLYVGTRSGFLGRCNEVLKNRATWAIEAAERERIMAHINRSDIKLLEEGVSRAQLHFQKEEYQASINEVKCILDESRQIVARNNEGGTIENRVAAVGQILSTISRRISGNWRPLGMVNEVNDWSRHEQAKKNEKVSIDDNVIMRTPMKKYGEIIEGFNAIREMLDTTQNIDHEKIMAKVSALKAEVLEFQAEIDGIIQVQQKRIRLPIKVAYVSVGRETTDSVNTYSWLHDYCIADYVRVDDCGVAQNQDNCIVNNATYDVIWIHQSTADGLDKSKKSLSARDVVFNGILNNNFIGMVDRHLREKKGVIVTGLAAYLINQIGIESKGQNMVSNGGYLYTTFDSGYIPCQGYEGHPLFKGLPHNGFLTNTNVYPYNQVSICAFNGMQPDGNVIANVYDSEVGRKSKYAAIIEYGSVLGGGIVLALGSQATDPTPGELTTVSGNSQTGMIGRHVQLMQNAINYLAEGKKYDKCFMPAGK